MVLRSIPQPAWLLFQERVGEIQPDSLLRLGLPLEADVFVFKSCVCAPCPCAGSKGGWRGGLWGEARAAPHGTGLAPAASSKAVVVLEAAEPLSDGGGTSGKCVLERAKRQEAGERNCVRSHPAKDRGQWRRMNVVSLEFLRWSWVEILQLLFWMWLPVTEALMSCPPRSAKKDRTNTTYDVLVWQIWTQATVIIRITPKSAIFWMLWFFPSTFWSFFPVSWYNVYCNSVNRGVPDFLAHKLTWLWVPAESLLHF